jgi:hypothetical protein
MKDLKETDEAEIARLAIEQASQPFRRFEAEASAVVEARERIHASAKKVLDELREQHERDVFRQDKIYRSKCQCRFH